MQSLRWPNVLSCRAPCAPFSELGLNEVRGHRGVVIWIGLTLGVLTVTASVGGTPAEVGVFGRHVGRLPRVGHCAAGEARTRS